MVLVYAYIYDAVLLNRNVNPNQELPSLPLLVATVTGGWTLDLWDAESGERIATPLLLRAKPLDIDYSFLHDMLFVGGEDTGIECIRLSSPDDLRFSDYEAFGLNPFAVAMTDYGLDLAHGTVSSGNANKVWGHLMEVTQQYATRLNEPLYRKEVHEEIAANARKTNRILTAKFHDLIANPHKEVSSEPVPELPTPELPIVSVEEWRKQVVDPVVKGDWAKALEIYENIFLLSEPTAGDYRIRSMLLFDAQRYDAALSDCEKIIDLGMSEWPIRLRRARCRTYLAQWENAVEELDGLVNEFPDERDVLMEHAEVNGYLKRWSSCRADYQSLILRFNDQQYARYSYAIACGSEGLTDAFEDACREYNIANQLNATPLQLLNTAILYAVCGDLETHEHAELLKVFIDNWKQADYYESFVKGALHYRLGDFDTATSELTAAVERTGELGTPLDLSFLAMCQIEAGELRIARKTLDDAHKSFARLQQGFPRGVVREKQPKSRPIGDISTWPNYAQSLLVLAEAEKLLVSKESEKPDVR